MKYSVLIVTALAALMVLSGCEMDEARAKRALQAQGLKEIRLKGSPWFGCGEHDTYSNSFIATGADGVTVTGVVCGGFGKGTTVRYD